MKTFTIPFVLFFSLILLSCNEKQAPLETILNDQIESLDFDVALYYKDLNTQDSIFINIDEEFHAASTMKVPVMMEMYRQQELGLINLQDSIMVINEFKSIVDGSPYAMDLGEDSDDGVYKMVGTQQTLYDLMFPMITRSSNLATNVLIEVVGAKNTDVFMSEIGAKNIEVLRGVEDQKAYDQGLSNSTTARDLGIIMESIALDQALSPESSKEMRAVLFEQEFNDLIPLYYPKDIKVAHKTGSITGVHHDAAIVYPNEKDSFILVILSKNMKDFDKDTQSLAKLALEVLNQYSIE
jgi:beta-lactamase class A